MATNMSDLNYELLGRLGVGEALLHYGKLDNHCLLYTSGGNSMPNDKMEPKAGGGKYCTNCGNALSDDMIFCPKCGTRQAKECPKCHTQLLPDAAFCHKCGTPC